MNSLSVEVGHSVRKVSGNSQPSQSVSSQSAVGQMRQSVSQATICQRVGQQSFNTKTRNHIYTCRLRTRHTINARTARHTDAQSRGTAHLGGLGMDTPAQLVVRQHPARPIFGIIFTNI